MGCLKMANEKRLIDANALLHEYCQANGCNEVNNEVCPNCFAAGLIAEAPAVDAVEVVRCKDCKNDGRCSIQDAMNWTPRAEIGDYYCSYGERRTDG